VIRVNGRQRPHCPGQTLLQLLEELALHPEAVVVELNGEVPPRRQWGETPLEAGDRLEVVRIIGGG